MNLSRDFFADIGAKIADKKCFSFAADGKTRDFLANYRWDAEGLQIPTVCNFTDIGTHLNLSAAPNGKTLSDRMVKAILMAKRLRWIPLNHKVKEHIVQANILPAGLYGAEASWVNKSILKALRAAIGNALGPRSARASNDIVFNNTTCSGDLDPDTYILTQRVTSLRRTIAKYPAKRDKVCNIIKQYKDSNNTCASSSNPCGPIGLLINSLEQVGAQLTHDLKITKEGEADIDIWSLPWQHLKKAISEMCANHRVAHASCDRSHLREVGEIDGQITKKIVNGLGPKERCIYNHISTGGAWSESHLQDIGLSQGKCTHCGQVAEDICHVTWHCPIVNKHRKIQDLQNVNPDLLPTYIKHGVPKAMSTDVEATFWGDKHAPDSLQDSKETLRAIGMQVTSQRKTLASCKNQEIKEVHKQNNLNPGTHNARPFFKKIEANKQRAQSAGVRGQRKPSPT